MIMPKFGKTSRARLIHGVGIKDADYQTSHKINGKTVLCPFYERWKGILRRCYSVAFKRSNPTYNDCTVCEEWLTFSKFKAWMEKQDWKGKEIDKDILIPNNKNYSPSTCIFVTPMINKFTTERGRDRGGELIGVRLNKALGKFESRCNNPIKNASDYLGLFNSEISAHIAWIDRKLEIIKLLRGANEIDVRIEKALVYKYESMKKTNLAN